MGDRSLAAGLRTAMRSVVLRRLPSSVVASCNNGDIQRAMDSRLCIGAAGAMLALYPVGYRLCHLKV